MVLRRKRPHQLAVLQFQLVAQRLAALEVQINVGIHLRARLLHIQLQPRLPILANPVAGQLTLFQPDLDGLLLLPLRPAFIRRVGHAHPPARNVRIRSLRKKSGGQQESE